MKKLLCSLLLLLLCLAAASPLLAAQLMTQPQGHYKAGPNAVAGAMNPPPGSNTVAFALAFNSFSDVRDNDGNSINGAPTMDMTVWTLRWIHMLENGFFGGSSGFNIAVTGAKMEADLGAFSKTETSLGDPSFELMQGWHWDRFDLRLRVGGFLGLGEYHKDSPTNYGQDFWSLHGQIGGTLWIDPAKRFSATLIGSYETNLEMDNYNISPGDALTVEGGIAARLSPNIQVALSAYHVRQITKDSGSDALYDKEHMYHYTAVGPHARIGMPFINPGASLHVTWWHAVDAKNAAKGDMIFTELQIPF
jgi:hypothetical protein